MLKNLFGSRKPKEKFSLENLKLLYTQLTREPIITNANKSRVVEILRTIAELMIWGDQHNPSFFDYFAEKSILANFVRILSQNKLDAKVKIQVIQTLSILIQNTESEISIFYLLSNNYINDLIVHRFDFSDEELLAYYISFLKTLSFKLNEKTILFFFNESANDFPLYTEAIKFFNHPESMVRIAVRTLSLNVYRVKDAAMRKFILNRSAVPYFSNLVWFLRDQTINLSHIIEKSNYLNLPKLEEFVESLIDLFYYLQDIMNLNMPELSATLIDQLLSHYVLPVLIGSLLPNNKLKHNDIGSDTTNTNANINAVDNTNAASVPAINPTPNATATNIDAGLNVPSPARSSSNQSTDSTGSANNSANSNSNVTTVPAQSAVTSVPAAISALLPATLLHKSSTPVAAPSSPAPSTSNTNPATPTSNSISAAATVATPATNGTNTASPISNSTAPINSNAANHTHSGPGLLTHPPTNETLIQTRLALYLLSQLFQSFTDYSFINSVCVALFHLHPPQLTQQIIVEPPQYPVKAEVPLTQILFPKSVANNKDNKDNKDNNTDNNTATSNNNNNSTATTTDNNPEVSTNSVSKNNATNSKTGRDLSNDRNLVARSALPEIGPVYSPIQTCPNYNEPAKENKYRKALIDYLISTDERLVFGACGVIYNAIKNESIDKELLNEVNIYPQTWKKTRKILDELTDDNTLFGDNNNNNNASRRNTDMDYENKRISAVDTILSKLKSEQKTSSITIPSSDNGNSNDLVKLNVSIDSSTGLVKVNIENVNNNHRSSVHNKPHHISNLSMDKLLDSSLAGNNPADLDEDEEKNLATLTSNDQPSTTTNTNNENNLIVDLSEDSSRPNIRASSMNADPLLNRKVVTVSSNSKSNTNATSSNPNSTTNSTTTTPMIKPETNNSTSPNVPPLNKKSSLVTSASINSEILSNNINNSNITPSYSYNIEVVRSLLSILNISPVYSYRLASFQLTIELLYELVYYAANAGEPCLAPQEVTNITQAYEQSINELKQKFHSNLAYLILDLIEDEYNTLSKPIQHKRLSISTCNLVAIEDNPISGLPLGFRRASGEFERTKVTVQVFLLLRMCYYKIMKKKDTLFPFGQGDGVSTTNMKADDEIQMNSNQDSIACTLAVGPKKINLFLVFDPDNLLLVIRHPNRVGYAIIQMIVSLRHQEPFLNRNNNCVLHVTIRSLNRPHPSCRKLKGGSAADLHAPLWNLTLLFNDSVQCIQSKRHLEQSRIRLRKLLLNNIFKSFNEPFESNGNQNNANNNSISMNNSRDNSRRNSLSAAAIGTTGDNNNNNINPELEAELSGRGSFSLSNNNTTQSQSQTNK